MKNSPSLIVAFLFLTATLIALSCAVCAETSTENTWETKQPLPQTHVETAVAVGDKIYAFFWRPNCENHLTYEYDPANETWTQKTAMPTVRSSYAVAVVDTKIYILGGYLGWANADGSVGSAPSNLNEVYDTATDTWETKQPLSQAMVDIGANVVDGKIYVIGGLTNDMIGVWGIHGSTFVQVYDPESDSWTQKDPAPYSMARYFSCVMNEKIYIINDPSEYLAEGTHSANLYIYDTKTGNWTTGSSPPTKYYGSGIAVTTGLYAPERIYIIGGYVNLGFAQVSAVSSTYAYDPVFGVWSKAADMPTARAAFAAVLGDKIFVLGGALSSSTLTGNSTDVVEVYTPLGYGFPVQASPSPSSPQPTTTIELSPTSSPSIIPEATPSTPAKTLTPTPTASAVQLPISDEFWLIAVASVLLGIFGIILFRTKATRTA